MGKVQIWFAFVGAAAFANAQQVAWLYQTPADGFPGTPEGCFFNGVCGDLDGDGYEDVLASNGSYAAPIPTGGFLTNAGKIQVFSGFTGALLREHYGTSSFNGLHCCGTVGDVDGDGMGDYLVASQTYSAGIWTNHHQVVSGATGIIGPDVPVYCFASSTKGLGDVNNDGIEDFVTGTGGCVVVWSGADFSAIFSLCGVSGNYMGLAIDTVGDVDGDAITDFIVGSPTPDNPSFSPTVGHAYLVSAGTATLLSVLSVAGAQNRFGRTVSGLGDVSGDGIPDFLVGAPSISKVFVYSGAPGTPLLYSLTSPQAGTFAGAQFGLVSCGTGDVDGDGWPDYVIRTDSAAFSLRSGPTGAEISLVPPQAGYTIYGLRRLTDLEGDGYPDLLLALQPTAYLPPTNSLRYSALSMRPTGLTIGGLGCPLPSGSAPRIAAGTKPVGGAVLTLGLSKCDAGAAATLLVGVSTSQFAGLPLPLDLSPLGFGGCQLMTSADILMPSASAAASNGLGAATQSVQIPLGLTGAMFFSQWVAEAASGPGLALTPLLTAVVQ